MRALTIFGLLLVLLMPSPGAWAALQSCGPSSCCCGDEPSCPCTVGPEEPKPAEPTQTAVEAPAPQAEPQPEACQDLALQPLPAEAAPPPSRAAFAVYIFTCTFRC